MSNKMPAFTENIVDVAGTRLQMRIGGDGEPLLILHGELGFPGWMKYHSIFSESYKTIAPSHPGYDKSDRLEWVANIRDLAGWYLEALDDLGLDGINVIGFSMGGWLAAEMAVMHPAKFQKIVLVSAMGIKPEQGEIYDIFLNLPKDFLKVSFLNPDLVSEFEIICPDDPSESQVEAWELGREQSCRMSWKPYMYNPTLKHLLGRLKMLDTLIVWGGDDAIVPKDCGRIYNSAIKGSHLEIIDKCGHRPEIEQAHLFSDKVLSFLS